jgi:hypothetical protein
MKTYYFESIDSETCDELDYFISNAKEDGLDEIGLIRAVPDNDPNYAWCTQEGDVVQRNECTKSYCEFYKANKSGRGVCVHRGKLYRHGNEVIFKIKP